MQLDYFSIKAEPRRSTAHSGAGHSWFEIKESGPRTSCPRAEPDQLLEQNRLGKAVRALRSGGQDARAPSGKR